MFDLNHLHFLFEKRKSVSVSFLFFSFSGNYSNMQKENKNKNIKKLDILLMKLVNENVYIRRIWTDVNRIGYICKKIFKVRLESRLEIRLVLTDISFKFMNGFIFMFISTNLTGFDRETRSELKNLNFLRNCVHNFKT